MEERRWVDVGRAGAMRARASAFGGRSVDNTGGIAGWDLAGGSNLELISGND